MPVEWNRQFPTKNVVVNDATKTNCDESWCEGLNVGVLQSSEPQNEDTNVSPPLISGVVSTIGAIPSVTVGFCGVGREEECELSTNSRASSPSSNFWKRALENKKDRVSASGMVTRTPNLRLLTFGPKSFVGETIFGLGVIIPRLVEFEDHNANLEFEEGIDSILQDVSMQELIGESSKMSAFSKTVPGEPYKEYVVEITSETIDLRCEMTPVTDRSFQSTNMQRIRSQNSVRCVVKLKQFPFLSLSSNLALHLFLITPNGFEEHVVRDDLKHTVTFVDRTSLSPRCFFSWTPVAYSLRHGDEAKVKVSSLNRVEIDKVPYSLAKSIVHWNRDESKSFTTYASISSRPSSSDIFTWDFSVGYGSPPTVRENDDNVDVVMFLLVAIVVFTFVLGVLANTRHGRRIALRCSCCCPRRIRIDEGIADVVWGYYYDDDDDDDASASSSKAPLLKMEEEDEEVFVIQTVQKPTVRYIYCS